MFSRYWNRVLDFRHDAFFPSAWPVALWLALWDKGDY